MAMSDPIADMLTRIRNANIAYHDRVEIPASSIKENIARLLLEEGYIRGYRRIESEPQDILRLYLKYGDGKQRVITNLKRISRPGCRVYVSTAQLPRVLGGLGIAVISTSKGLLTSPQCQRERVGGEVLCHVW